VTDGLIRWTLCVCAPLGHVHAPDLANGRIGCGLLHGVSGKVDAGDAKEKCRWNYAASMAYWLS